MLPATFVLQTKGFTCSLGGRSRVRSRIQPPTSQSHLIWRSIGVSIPCLFADNELCFLYTNEPKNWMPAGRSNPALRFTRPVHHHNACRQKMIACQNTRPIYRPSSKVSGGENSKPVWRERSECNFGPVLMIGNQMHRQQFIHAEKLAEL